jgi:hypothetical protein
MTIKTVKAHLIPAGLDLGSRNARIAIIPKSQQKQEQNQSKAAPQVVSNEIGQRYTLALSIVEPKAESDPMNDQFWDKPGSNKKKNENNENEVAKPTFIHGDAARRTLHRLKKPLGPNFVSHIVHEAAMATTNSNDNDDSSETQSDNEENKLQAAQSFFSHLSTQATNADGATSHPSALRYVLAIPPTTAATTEATTSTYVSAVEHGISLSMQQCGYDTAPEVIHATKASASQSLNKREKKELIQKIERTEHILAVITNPVAIGHAHGLFDNHPTTPTVDDATNVASNWKNILVIDWGASSLTLSHLKNIGTTNLTSLHLTQTESKSCCGINILNILVSHVAELFERKVRGSIPRGETLMNKKAKAKLEVACEDTLRSFGYGSKAHVTIDGLIDGIDCQVEIMLARFEMLLTGALRMAEGMIKDFVAKSGVEFDGVLSSGGIMRMTCVDAIMKRLFQGQWRGKGIGDVAPEEAIALGCASYAHALLEASLTDETGDVQESVSVAEESKQSHVIEQDVFLSPIGIGLSLQEGDAAAVILIEKSTPLPALVTKTVSLVDVASSSLGVMQITNDSNAAEKMIGKIEGIDTSASSLEVTMELSCKGQLSVLINGGDPFII